MELTLFIPVQDVSQAGEARRRTGELGEQLGLDETQRGKLAIVVTELARNIALHGRAGELLVRLYENGNQLSVELLALDKGPGMANVSECLRDGYSTAGTPGKGLGAITRLSDEMEIYSQPGAGTAVLARLHHRLGPARPGTPGDTAPGGGLEIGLVCVPYPGEPVPGDSWATRQAGDRTLLMVVDGLGHGPLAATAAREAVRIFNTTPYLSPVEIIEAAHGALRATRGAAMAVAELDPQRREVRFAGIGNIAGSVVLPGASSSMVSLNGTVGAQIRKVQEFHYAWPPGALVVMASDGLGTAWRMDRYPGLIARAPALIAGVLYRDFTRGRDDVTVLAAREA